MEKEFQQKKYFIQTYGCQANIADSNTIGGVLEALGFIEGKSMSDSDVFIVNTCSVRQKSEDKVYGLGKEVKRLNDSGKKVPFIIMAGCMVGSVTGTRQRYEFEELKDRTPWVDSYINPTQIMEIPNILQENKVLSDWAVQKFNPKNVLALQDSNTHAFVNISFGCDNFCTFCVVPYARGKEVSRSKEEILREIKHFVLRGISEVTLCGQNVNSWGMDMEQKFEIRTGEEGNIPFADLLKEIHEIEEINQIGFLSSNPFDFGNEMIEVMRLPKTSPYLHIAVQSGNNDVLKRMNRRHTIEEFIDLVEKIKEVRPDVELGTDIIVGFPGETREQFFDTVRLFEKVSFNVAFISIYSPRKGTPAERFYKDDVSLKEKKWRHAKLTEVWKQTRPEIAKRASSSLRLTVSKDSK